jgi:siroheme synthase
MVSSASAEPDTVVSVESTSAEEVASSSATDAEDASSAVVVTVASTSASTEAETPADETELIALLISELREEDMAASLLEERLASEELLT